jgi:hypothetical protein
MPGDDGLGLEEEQGVWPIWPEAPQDNPEQSMGRAQLGFVCLPFEHRELVSERQILKNEVRAGLEAGKEGLQKGQNDIEHRGPALAWNFVKSSLSRMARFSLPTPKRPSPKMIRAIWELRGRNPRFGRPKIAQHLNKTFGLDIDKDVVRPVLAAHCGPSVERLVCWLEFDELFELGSSEVQFVNYSFVADHIDVALSIGAKGSNALRCRADLADELESAVLLLQAPDAF